MPKSQKEKEVLNYAKELVDRHQKLMQEKKQNKQNGRPIRPSAKRIGKYWPLEMLVSKYGALLLQEDLLKKVFKEIGVTKRQQIKALLHANDYFRRIQKRQCRE